MIPSQFLLLADALPEALILLSADGQILAVNPPAIRFLNHPKEKIKGSHLTDYVNNDDEQVHRLLRTWARSRTPMPAPLSWLYQKNEKPSWRCKGFLLQPAAGDDPAYIVLRCTYGRSPASEFIALNKEIDQQKIMLQKLQESRMDLAMEHEKAMVTLHSIGDAVITTDKNGVVEYLNPIAEQLTGWTNEEANGKTLSEVFNIINELSRKAASDPVERCLREGRIVGLANHTALISRSGVEYIIEDSAAPIRLPRGSVLGAVLVFRDMTGDRLARRQLEYLAQHDTLTGLNNRYFFEQQLKQNVKLASRGNTEHALLYIDLDEFKIVNDTAGHGAGDDLLVEVAQLFSRRLRQGDALARLGGDEFGVLLNNVNAGQAEDVARSFSESMTGFRFEWEGRTFDITPSIGIAIINMDTGSPAEAMREADIACYIAKQQGRNRIHIYSSEDDEKLVTAGELSLVNEIREALSENNFVLYFQTVMDIKNNSALMHEALLRMKSRNGKLISPGTFIPVAERYGIMQKIDCWVVDNVIKLMKKNPGLKISVNLSGPSIGDNELLALVKRQLDKYKVSAQNLTFEITETAAVGHIERAGEFMRELKKIGCRFALDDFGTGFSSFTYLKHLPADYIKIDGAFIRDIVDDPVDQAMVRSINQIAHSLGKKTIAEFVEHQDILDQLMAFGIDYAQGYYLGEPSPNIDTVKP